jgi:multidrug efflux pump subunit AcrA (membrane-fusion protein)
MNLLSGLFTRSKGMVRRMVTVDEAATEYERALAAAAAAERKANDDAQARYDKAAAAAAEAVRRAERAHADAGNLASRQHREARERALAEFDDALKAAAGAPPEAFLRQRADGLVEVRVDDFGRAAATAGGSRDSWWVDSRTTGRAFYGDFAKARAAMWAAARPADREPVR